MATRRSTIKSRWPPKPKVAPKPGWMGLNPPKSEGKLPRMINEPIKRVGPGGTAPTPAGGQGKNWRMPGGVPKPLPPGVTETYLPNYPRGGGPKPKKSTTRLQVYKPPKRRKSGQI